MTGRWPLHVDGALDAPHLASKYVVVPDGKRRDMRGHTIPHTQFKYIHANEHTHAHTHTRTHTHKHTHMHKHTQQ